MRSIFIGRYTAANHQEENNVNTFRANQCPGQDLELAMRRSASTLVETSYVQHVRQHGRIIPEEAELTASSGPRRFNINPTCIDLSIRNSDNTIRPTSFQRFPKKSSHLKGTKSKPIGS